MKRSSILIFLCFNLLLCCSSLTIAQTSLLKGNVTDEKGEPLPDITVILKQPWGANFLHVQTNQQGRFEFLNVPSGGYKIEIIFIGYEPFVKEILVSKETLELGTIQLKLDSKLLQEVTVKDKKLPAKVIADTLQFDASSYKVAKDASAEDLIEKMPSVTKENGRMKSQNEDVKKVLVDGKPFFGDDPSLSLKNLPAELIDKVQIFDQQSEQSQFTGVSDANTVKTINIVTKGGLNNGQFGKVYAGYTFNQHYQTGGNVNYFDGNRRISLIAMSNDINIQNFSSEDILGVTGNSGNRDRGRGPGGGGSGGQRFPSQGGVDFYVPQSGGVAQTHSVGLNYSDIIAKNVEISFSYFFNDMENEIESGLNRYYFSTDNRSQTYLEQTTSSPHNSNHRLQGRIDITLDSMSSLQIRPRLSIQDNQNEAINNSTNYFNSILANTTFNTINTHTNGYNFSNNVLFRHKFSKPKRTISLDWNLNSAPKEDQALQYSESEYYNPSALILDTINQFEKNTYSKKSWSTNFEYTEPLTADHVVLLTYRYGESIDATDINTFDLPLGEIKDTFFNNRLSNYFSSKSKSHQIGMGYQWNIAQKLNLSTRVNWQTSMLDNKQFSPLINHLTKAFYNVVPSMFLRYNITTSKNLMLTYRSFTQLPTIEQLQNVVNNSNPVRLTTGNPALKQALQHSASIRYNATLKNSNLLFTSLRFNVTQDYITNHSFIRDRSHPLFKVLKIPLGTQLIIPQNAGTSIQIRSFFSYSYPWTTTKSLLSIDFSHTYNKTPGLLDGDKIQSRTHTVGFGMAFSSNISTKVDYNLQFRPSFNSIVNNTTENQYWLYEGRTRISYQFYKRFVLKADGNYRNNSSLEAGYDDNVFLINLAIGMKLFKNERGELAIGVNDLFDQNQNIQRNITELYYEDSYSNNLRRFMMVSFTYNIRNFNTGKKPDKRNNDQDNFPRRPYEGPRY